MGTRVAIVGFAIALVAGAALAQTPAGGERAEETHVLVLSPKPSTRANETHAALVLSVASYSGDVTFRGRVRTVKQLRSGSDPNPWECVWIVWNYYGGNFYYLALKTNGWEIGKRDHTQAGQQRFLKTGKAEFQVGGWHDFEISQKQNEITIQLDGEEVASLEDVDRPYTFGRIGFYTEDAEVQVDDVTAPFKDNFEDYPLQTIRGDGRVVKNWYLPYLGHGYAAISTGKK
ncbi:MAG TPA: family 16 glycoside hydrolase [Xanthobacteraceae bacterium]|nr:family 16 glycoside hydrolase [Xanthobacteraceae bacterium]